MIANKKFKGFGPSQAASLSHFSAPVYQRGEGLGSFFSNIFSKIAPFAKTAIKKIATSDLTKTASKQLAKHGTTAAANIAADVISGINPTIKAKKKLDQARDDIANIIRNAPKRRKGQEGDVNSKSKKKRKNKPIINKLKNNKKKFDIFSDS